MAKARNEAVAKGKGAQRTGFADQLKSPKGITVIALFAVAIGLYVVIFVMNREPPLTPEDNTDSVLREIPMRVLKALNANQPVTDIPSLPPLENSKNSDQDVWGRPLTMTFSDLPNNEKQLIVVSAGRDGTPANADDRTMTAVFEYIEGYKEFSIKITTITGGE
jgi:hypothetical protein